VSHPLRSALQRRGSCMPHRHRANQGTSNSAEE